MKLTSERVNGIKSGYWSPAKKEELTQKLGAIEYQAPRLLENICKGICLHRMPKDKDSDEVCRGCPLNELTALIER